MPRGTAKWRFKSERFITMNKRLQRVLLAMVVGFLVAGQASAKSSHKEEAIRAVLAAQAEAWNRGDLDGFMSGYERSETLRFASGDSVTYGWQTTLDRYRARYPDRATMGTLRFSDLSVEVLSSHHALVFGHWALKRANDQPKGLFTLLMHKTEDGWKVASDHTSAAN
jgi:ketosteroid isomerase-like protein